jgi:putative chitinase
MNDQEARIRQLVEEFTRELVEVLRGLPSPEGPEIVVTANRLDLKPFFDHIRKPLFNRLTAKQVSGHEDIIKELRKRGVPLPEAAYVLATAYHETAKTMQPVREGLRASDAWRKRNLRYYPWYGRGHVQLTWEENYRKADQKLGLGGALVANPDLALDPDVSAQVLVLGSVQGWFSGDKNGRHTLARHIKTGTRAEYRQARRIINIMDKADLIAGHALVYKEALQKAGY